MPRLIAAIIRHAEYRQLPDTPSAHQPFALTAEGEEQARQAASMLRETIVSNGWSLSPVVDTSQLLRAWQTARIIADQLSDLFAKPLEVIGFDNLAERSLGSANNLTMNQVETIVREDPRFPPLPRDWKSNSHYRLPLQGAESLMEAGARVAAHLQNRMDALAQNAKTGTLKLFVGHGAAFRHAAYHLGVLEFDDIARLSMYHAQPVYIEYIPDNKADHQWRQIGGEWKIRNTGGDYTD
ncbi:MAG: histidine phosphatase family protein [Gammaproteobacteria bacterium]|jgi:2,3-bisphosphoglycerate-dependent phosphoglycerate mutase